MNEFQRTKEFCDYFYLQARDNLFSANHRSRMIARYGYTEAEFVEVDPSTGSIGYQLLSA